MNTTLLLALLMVYITGIVIMFIVPEGWMPKGNTPDRKIREKGFARKVFAVSGAITIIVVLIVSYFLK
jgi:hypothetical protein